MVGRGATAVMYYRVLLPAHVLGLDYVGIYGDPPKARYATGLVNNQSVMPDFTAYDLIVFQQVAGRAWLEVIKALQAMGKTVVYEVDDWLHGVASVKGHDFRKRFDKQALAGYEMCMKAADALIVSSDFIARAYRSFNRRVFVCRNGIDASRYKLTRPARPTVNIGWAGATGHDDAMVPWLRAVTSVMLDFPQTCFVTIGQRYADSFRPAFGARALSVPFTAIEQYPAAMTMLDIALAPVGPGGFHKAKSDLRWLEASALGIPVVADATGNVYGEIDDGVTGFKVTKASQLVELLSRLVENEQERLTVGTNARDYVLANRDATVMAQQWASAFAELLVD